MVQVGGSDVLACGSSVNGMIGWGSLYWLQVMKDNSAGRARMRSALALCALGAHLPIDWVCSVHCLRSLSVYSSSLADVSDDWSYSMMSHSFMSLVLSTWSSLFILSWFGGLVPRSSALVSLLGPLPAPSRRRPGGLV